MIGPPIAIVVDTDDSARLQTQRIFESAAFIVMGAASFPDGKALLASMSPDIVIADIRLKAFNGLHLAALCTIWRPGTPFIVTHDRYDAGLEADARRLNALFVLKTLGAEGLTTAAFSLLNARVHGGSGVRRSHRKPAPVATLARVSASKAELVDVSYGGAKLKLHSLPPAPTKDGLPDAFEVVLPELDVLLHAARIWASPDNAAGGWVCGIDVSGSESQQLQRWRDFVDDVESA
jgi:CheY-like chemotaxis protein